MFESVKNYVYDRRQGLSTFLGFAGGLYVGKRYLTDRLEEVKEGMEQERGAKEILRRRFLQSQDDISFTILALLPTLSEQILSEMDVEALTNELQSLSRSRKALDHSSIQSPPPPPMQIPRIELSSPGTDFSLSTTGLHPVDTSAQDDQSDAGSVSTSHRSTTSYDEVNASSIISTGEEQTWVLENGSVRSESLDRSSTTGSADGELVNVRSPNIAEEQVQALTDSVFSLSAQSDITNASTSSETRTKAELWNEIKMLTFTRTLTALYSTTLLSLLTTLQLTLLARSKYVSSVYAQEREDRLREKLEAQLSVSNLLFGSLGGGGGMDSLFDMDAHEDNAAIEWMVSDDLETKYLTLSWWLLHVGWKDVGERVRRAVQEVFEGVSLKTKLSAFDLHMLIRDIRRRVEFEITFEGTERRIDFLSTMLPPTAETIRHVLVQGGYVSPSSQQFSDSHQLSSSLTASGLSEDFLDSPALGLSDTRHPYSSRQSGYRPEQPIVIPSDLLSDPLFAALIMETRDVITSPDFARTVEVSLDRATEVMLGAIEAEVFNPGENPGEETRARLAGLLPDVARWAPTALNGLPNELVDSILSQREVPCLSAIVFSKFSDMLRR